MPRGVYDRKKAKTSTVKAVRTSKKTTAKTGRKGYTLTCDNAVGMIGQLGNIPAAKSITDRLLAFVEGELFGTQEPEAPVAVGTVLFSASAPTKGKPGRKPGSKNKVKIEALKPDTTGLTATEVGSSNGTLPLPFNPPPAPRV
jgi:hypothetical protein